MERHGTAPLTWGQQGIWAAIERNAPAHYNVGVAVPVPPGCRADVAAMVTAVARLLSRHEALRTRILLLDGEPRQVVERPVTPDLELVEAADEDVPQLVCRLRAVPFDYPGGDLPVRIVLVGTAGVVRYVLLAFCHVAVDLFALHIACRDLVELLTGDPAPVSSPQPSELAHRQRTPAGQRRTTAALTYWSSRFRQLRTPMFGTARHPEATRFRSALLVSPAIGAAARLVAARQGVSDATVLHAGCAELLRRWTSERTCHLQVLTNNRFWPRHDQVVSHLCQLGLFVSTVADGTPFAEVLRHTERAAVSAHRNAYYDQFGLDRALDRLRQDLGRGVRSDCYYNDVRSDGPQTWTVTSHPTFDIPAATVGECGDGAAVRRATRATSFRWLADPESMQCSFSLRLFGPPVAPRISLSADTRYLPADDLERFLSSFEDLLVEAAT